MVRETEEIQLCNAVQLPLDLVRRGAGWRDGETGMGWDQNKLLQCFVIAPSPLFSSSPRPNLCLFTRLPRMTTSDVVSSGREGERAASDIAAVRAAKSVGV